MKFILFFVSIVFTMQLPAQTTTTSSGGQKNTQANSAYVTPVVTVTYSPKADAYTWNPSKSSFTSNPSYSAPNGNVASASGNQFGGRLFGRPRSEIRAERRYLANSKINSITYDKSSKMGAVGFKINEQITKLAKNYDEGNYFASFDNVRTLYTLYGDLGRLFNELLAATGTPGYNGYPSNEQYAIEKFYTLLTYNKVGRDGGVLSEYFNNYTSCADPKNKICNDERLARNGIVFPFVNICSVRDCPDNITALNGLPMEDLFELELAFTESAALLGFQAFATENLKSIMNYYNGKVQLSPYYLYMASIEIATGNSDIAQQLYNQYKLDNENEADGRLQLKIYLQKVTMFYILKGNTIAAEKYMNLYQVAGQGTVSSQRYLIDLLRDKRWTMGRENKLITQWLEKEWKALLQNKEFINQGNPYASSLDDYSGFLYNEGKYQEARTALELSRANAGEYFYNTYGLDKLRCLTGGIDSVIAERNRLFTYRDENGKRLEISVGTGQSALQYMELMNIAGRSDKVLEILEYMKGIGVKKAFGWQYAIIKDEALIAYYHLKDYSNARKMMGDPAKALIKYRRYYAKIYALDGDIAKAKELYRAIANNIETQFDDEDIRFIDQ